MEMLFSSIAYDWIKVYKEKADRLFWPASVGTRLGYTCIMHFKHENASGTSIPNNKPRGTANGKLIRNAKQDVHKHEESNKGPAWRKCKDLAALV